MTPLPLKCVQLQGRSPLKFLNFPNLLSLNLCTVTNRTRNLDCITHALIVNRVKSAVRWEHMGGETRPFGESGHVAGDDVCRGGWDVPGGRGSVSS